MADTAKLGSTPISPDHDQPRKDIERFNARLRHFRGVASGVLDDAQALWQEIWDACRDTRTCEDILLGEPDAEADMPAGGWPELREKLHLLGHYIDYTRRLCDGSLNEPAGRKKEV